MSLFMVSRPPGTVLVGEGSWHVSSGRCTVQGDGATQPFATLNLFVTLSWKPLTILGVLKNC
jgi:hypothetical protein